ncbi:MAG: oligosaccharide flippase family protein [Rhodocyclaceae bacterium]
MRAMLVAFGRALQLVLMLLMMRLATGILPPVEMGRMALINSSTALFALFLIGPVGLFINRRLIAWNEAGAVQHNLSRYWGYVLGVCALTSLVLLVLDHFGLGPAQAALPWLLWLIAGSLFFNTLNQTLIPSLNLLGFGAWFVVLTLATLVVGLVLALILALYGRPDAEYWLSGLLAGQAVVGLAGWWVFSRKINPPQGGRQPPGRAQYMSLFMFAWPIVLSAALGWIQTQGYRFVLSATTGLESLGLFVVGYGLAAGLVAGLESVLTTWLHPIFYRQLSDGQAAQVERAWNGYAAAILPSMLLFTCLVVASAPWVTRLLLGPQYAASSIFVVWGALAELLRVLASVYGMAAHARMKTSWLLVPAAAGAVLATVLVSSLVPPYAGAGAAAALCVTGLVVVLLWHLRIRREISISLPARDMLAALAMGGVLLLFAGALAYLPGFESPLLNALTHTFLLGLLYLGMQYWLLSGILRASRVEIAGPLS